MWHRGLDPSAGAWQKGLGAKTDNSEKLNIYKYIQYTYNSTQTAETKQKTFFVQSVNIVTDETYRHKTDGQEARENPKTFGKKKPFVSQQLFPISSKKTNNYVNMQIHHTEGRPCFTVTWLAGFSDSVRRIILKHKYITEAARENHKAFFGVKQLFAGSHMTKRAKKRALYKTDTPHHPHTHLHPGLAPHMHTSMQDRS